MFFEIGPIDRSSFFDSREIHLIPFLNTVKSFTNVFAPDFNHEEKTLYQAAVIGNIIGNILLLFPWGVLAPLLIKKLQSLKSLAFSALLISLSAESIQLILSIGVFDIDDIIFNTSGAILGYYLIMNVKKTIQKKTDNSLS